MKWYPFAHCWLKASENRETLEKILLDVTFLSDAGFKNDENRKIFFYGTVNEKEFDLESIDKEKKLTSFVHGKVLGIGNETFISLHFGAFRYQRVFLIVLLFTLLSLSLFIYGLLKNQSANSSFYLSAMGLVVAFLLVNLFSISMLFSKKLRYSIDFFRGMYNAEIIGKKDVPDVFLL